MRIKTQSRNSLIIIIVLLFSSSCSLLKGRSSDLERDKSFFRDLSVFERKSKGDNVSVVLAKTPNKRPKATTNRYNGKQGAHTDVTFDEDGTVLSIVTDCPEIDEREERNLTHQRNLKIKKTEHKFNLDVAKLASKTIITVGFFFALAWVARAFVKR